MNKLHIYVNMTILSGATTLISTKNIISKCSPPSAATAKTAHSVLVDLLITVAVHNTNLKIPSD